MKNPQEYLHLADLEEGKVKKVLAPDAECVLEKSNSNAPVEKVRYFISLWVIVAYRAAFYILCAKIFVAQSQSVNELVTKGLHFSFNDSLICHAENGIPVKILCSIGKSKIPPPTAWPVEGMGLSPNKIFVPTSGTGVELLAIYYS